uniref:C2H2-type domain-containing protein n=1 Tax=Caenorhabditis tropicalis TaxID=1561998 RepID=A0A1I7TDV9_9PELO
MDIHSIPSLKDRSVGMASILKRYGASMANHKNYSRREFITTLAEAYTDLEIEERPETPETISNENGEEIEEPITQIEWLPLQCPKCFRKATDTQALLVHLVEIHGKPEDKLWYKEFNTVGLDLNQILEKAMSRQTDNSRVKRKFNNSNDVIVCPTESRLAPFMMMRHLQIFIREIPSAVTDGISLKVKNKDKETVIIFSFQKVDKVRRRIKRAMAKKLSANMFLQLEKRCGIDSIADIDIVLKRSRTAEEQNALIESLDLPANCSRGDIIKKVEEMKAKQEEVNPFCSNVYTKVVKPDGQVMSKEEKRLISSLTNDMVMPVAGKRKTTFKNLSELVPKKRQKTTSPQ